MSLLDNTTKLTCPRCKGHKTIRGQEGNRYRGENYKLPNYKKVEAGICFLCDGEGLANYNKEKNIFVKEKNGAILKYNTNGRYLGWEAQEFPIPTFEFSNEPPAFEMCVDNMFTDYDGIDEALRVHEIEMLRAEETEEIIW